MASLRLPDPKMMDVAVPANMRQGLHQEEVARRGWGTDRSTRCHRAKLFKCSAKTSSWACTKYSAVGVATPAERRDHTTGFGGDRTPHGGFGRLTLRVRILQSTRLETPCMR